MVLRFVTEQILGMSKELNRSRSTINNSYLLLGALLMINPVMAEEQQGDMPQPSEKNAKTTKVQPYHIEKGSQFALCRDLVPYLQKSEAAGGGGKNSLFLLPDDKFSNPNWQSEKAFLGIKLMMQDYAYSPSTLDGRTGWKKRIEGLEELQASDFIVKSAKIDFNNNGAAEHILNVSWYYEKLKKKIYLSYPLNQYGNLDIAMFERELPRAISGEIFLYQGRTFSLEVSKYHNVDYQYSKKILVNEHFPSAMRNSGGLAVRPSVCKLVIFADKKGE